ncbi:hypothetical protein [Noviherbaspirillum suwonense]|uniref:hypothetical protein n=1 Tax=Noviherbaspirillum suwonense TaxID=1224511 RepID=UPI0024B81FAF|nr:hypothetical protein [Noviherbaspirillum suwonense]
MAKLTYSWQLTYLADSRRPNGMENVVEMLAVTALTAGEGSGVDPPGAVLELRSFALYVLSRGEGVSDRGRKVLADFRKMLRNMSGKGQVAEISETRIGIEGETKICARFASAELAAKTWIDIQRSLADADLVVSA